MFNRVVNWYGAVCLLIVLLIFPSISLAEQTEPREQLSAKEFFEKGREFYLQKKFYQAIPLFEKAVEEQPKNAEYKCWLAQTLAYTLGEEAKKGASRLSLMPKARRVWNLYEEALELNPQSERARVGYAIIKRDAPGLLGGDLEEAEKMLKSVIEDNPQNIFALHHLGNLYVEKKEEIPTGIHYLKRAIKVEDKRELTPEEEMRLAGTYNSLGKAFMKMDNYEVAVGYLEEAVKRDPSNAVDMLVLADVYLKLEQKEQAKKTLRSAITIIEKRDYKKVQSEAKDLADKLDLTKELNL